MAAQRRRTGSQPTRPLPLQTPLPPLLKHPCPRRTVRAGLCTPDHLVPGCPLPHRPLLSLPEGPSTRFVCQPDMSTRSDTWWSCTGVYAGLPFCPCGGPPPPLRSSVCGVQYSCMDFATSSTPAVVRWLEGGLEGVKMSGHHALLANLQISCSFALKPSFLSGRSELLRQPQFVGSEALTQARRTGKVASRRVSPRRN